MGPGFVLLTVVVATWVPHAYALTEGELQKFMDRGVKVTVENGKITLSSNGVPAHAYGPFGPGTGNPNYVEELNFTITVEQSPVKAAQPGCLGMGAIGMMSNGVAYFNPYNILLQNAVEGPTAEVFDACNGHPQQQGMYHYHQIPNCLISDKAQGGPNEFLGVSLDGFPIYGPRDETGKVLASKDLDVCHGRYYNGNYQYHVTSDYPYLQGCYHGTPAQMAPPTRDAGGQGGMGGGGQQGRPPRPNGGQEGGMGGAGGAGGAGGGGGQCSYASQIQSYEHTGEGIDTTNNNEGGTTNTGGTKGGDSTGGMNDLDDSAMAMTGSLLLVLLSLLSSLVRHI